jgi:hypothetical protein
LRPPRTRARRGQQLGEHAAGVGQLPHCTLDPLADLLDDRQIRAENLDPDVWFLECGIHRKELEPSDGEGLERIGRGTLSVRVTLAARASGVR